MKLGIISILILAFTLFGCSSKSNPTRKPVTNIQITPSNNIVLHGNEFTVGIQSKQNKSKIEYVEIYLNNQLIKKTSDDSYSQVIDTKNLLPGNHVIKTIAVNKEGTKGTNFVNVSVLSEIQPTNIQFDVVGTIEHNTKKFTQGLEFYQGNLFESTGDHGTSFIFKYNSNISKTIKELKIEDQYFGEGITILNNKIYQLTYKHKKGFIYDTTTFEKIGEFNFSSTEGWGFTNDGKYLIMSDGTSTITYLDPNNFSIIKTIQVTHPKGFVTNLNELEYVNGNIFANIWTTDQIVKFDANNGKVLAIIDLSVLKTKMNTNGIDVLNGIAFNKSENLFYITGKLWPKIFKIKLIE